MFTLRRGHFHRLENPILWPCSKGQVYINRTVCIQQSAISEYINIFRISLYTVEHVLILTAACSSFNWHRHSKTGNAIFFAQHSSIWGRIPWADLVSRLYNIYRGDQSTHAHLLWTPVLNIKYRYLTATPTKTQSPSLHQSTHPLIRQPTHMQSSLVLVSTGLFLWTDVYLYLRCMHTKHYLLPL